MWSKSLTTTQLQGISQTQNPKQSSKELACRDEEGHEGTFQLFIVPCLPVNLWDQDGMAQMEVYLYSPYAIATNQIFLQE